MIRTLRAFFLHRVLREKLLLVGFLGVAVVMWGSAFSSRASRFWRSQARTTAELKEQDKWLALRPQIEALTHDAAAKMDPAKTLDQTAFVVEVRRLATEAGVKFSSGAVKPDQSVGQFSINLLQLNITNTEWHAFAVFYQRLQERAPYMAVRDIALMPARGSPTQVTANLTIASFEIKH